MGQDNLNQGRDQNIINNPGNVTFQYGSSERRSPPLNILLNMVQSEVRERLEQSIHRLLSVELINLGKVSQPSQIESPWGMTLNLPKQPPQDIPSETKILDIFDQSDIKKRLLLLGLPGSGKTTTMLELADGLLQRCEKTPMAPIPVLLNLASWKNKKERIFDWLVREINAKYSVRPSLGVEWLQQHQLLPLLDGLDEVDPQLQTDCAIAINQWLRQDPEYQPVGALICCRIEEYQTLVQHLLCLNAAIELQPLTDHQIEDYFRQFNIQDQ